MDIKHLQAMGAFVPQKLFKRTIDVLVPVQKPKEEWEDSEVPEFTGENSEEKMDVFIRRSSSADEIEIMRAPEREQPFIAIYRYVVNEKGAPVFESLDQAMTLSMWLVVPLFNAISEVTRNIPKASRGKTSSGSKSRLRSEDAAPKSGSTP